MTVQITTETMGYRVRFNGRAEEFDRALSLFKEILPRACRRFLGDQGCWFVQTRARPNLDRWLEAMGEGARFPCAPAAQSGKLTCINENSIKRLKEFVDG